MVVCLVVGRSVGNVFPFDDGVVSCSVACSEGMTVTAAEKSVDTATEDVDADAARDIVGAYVGSTATAVDQLHGIVAFVDIDGRGVGRALGG